MDQTTRALIQLGANEFPQKSQTRRPCLALVSIGIRRDLLAPLAYFTQFDLAHFYKKSVYGDLTPNDVDASLSPYSSPLDLYQQLVRAQPDVIQGIEPFSYYTQPFVWACVFAARKTRAALLIPTYENRPLDVKFGKLRAALLRRAVEIYFARACLIITHNQGARKNVLQCNAASHKIVRGMWGSWGVDTREFFPRTERTLFQNVSPQRSNQPPTLLFVGRLHQEKGVFVLLDAFAQVHQQSSDTRLLFAGEGPARDALASKIRALGLTNSITLCGTIKNRDIPNLFRKADIFCAPSLTTRKWAEQVGMSSLQAMASGVPIVSTHSGAIPEYVPDGIAGILVRENDSTALAHALLDLLSNPQRAQEMGKRGREYACARYDARENVERGEQLVREHCLARRV